MEEGQGGRAQHPGSFNGRNWTWPAVRAAPKKTRADLQKTRSVLFKPEWFPCLSYHLHEQLLAFSFTVSFVMSQEGDFNSTVRSSHFSRCWASQSSSSQISKSQFSTVHSLYLHNFSLLFIRGFLIFVPFQEKNLSQSMHTDSRSLRVFWWPWDLIPLVLLRIAPE